MKNSTSSGFRLIQMGASQLAAATAIGLACAVTAQAQVVSFHFTGTIAEIDEFTPGVRPAEITVGAAFSGTLSYETSGLIDGNPGNPGLADYNYGSEFFQLSLSIGGHTYTQEIEPGGPFNNIAIINSAADEIYYTMPNPLRDGAAWPNNPASPEILLTFKDASGSALTSDAIPTAAPSLAQFPSLAHLVWASGGEFSAFGALQSITPVPEPSALAGVSAAALLGFGLWRRSRR